MPPRTSFEEGITTLVDMVGRLVTQQEAVAAQQASHTMSMLDTMWSFLAVQQQQLSLFCARLGLEPPPPLPARPPSPPPLLARPSPPTPPHNQNPTPVLPAPNPYLKPSTPPPPTLLTETLCHTLKSENKPPPSPPLYTVANVFVPHYKSIVSNLHGPSLLACTLVSNNNQQETCFLRSSGQQISSTFLVSKNVPCRRFEDEARQRREWRPPWRPLERYVATKPNATGRREWRPPWRNHYVLEDKDDLKGRGVDTTRTASRPVKIHFNTTSFILACIHTSARSHICYCIFAFLPCFLIVS
ncbi:hypothetical protein HanIR_Chr09g0421011 [Helianthus annuus]|nr:hypothetical protein HanIR_Chr09g0421011 [Helianthus annuus]